MLPWKEHPLKSNIFKYLKKASCLNKVPVKFLLPCKSRYCNFLRLESLIGNFPFMPGPSCKILRFGRVVKKIGKDAVLIFGVFCSFIFWRFFRRASCVGMLLFMFSQFVRYKWLRSVFPICVGIGPLIILFCLSRRSTKLFCFPIWVGIFP